MLQKLKPYWQSLLDIYKYQILTKAIIILLLSLLGYLFRVLLLSAGRVAISSSDYSFVFTTWQGLLILLVCLISLFIYVAFDLNSKIILSRNLLTGMEESVAKSVREGFMSIAKLLNLRGVIVIIYITFFAPLVGLGVSISLTKGLKIPTFISSFIADSVLYTVLATFVFLVFLSIGVANLFILHGIILDNLSVKEAGIQSKRLMHENWKDYLKQNVLFILVIAVVIVGAAILCLVVPLSILYALPLSDGIRRILTIFLVLSGLILTASVDLFATPLYLMKMTQLYYSYKQGTPHVYAERPKKKHPYVAAGVALAFAAVIAATALLNYYFDAAFPQESTVKVIAHRAGGFEAPENTVKGLTPAYEAGAYGSEIDIQRTKDGHYVVNHDGSFKRVAKDKRKPSQMTLKEVKELSVDGEPVATFEEMLEGSRSKLVLFVELKGSTADRQMADDAVRIIREYGMEKECVLISLKYNLIDYIENTYPDMQTGFLTFFSFGNTAALNCDYLGLEEDSASTTTIDSIHSQNKKVLIWTPNKKKNQKHVLCSNVDGMITDRVFQARDMLETLKKRNDLERMIDRIHAFLG